MNLTQHVKPSYWEDMDKQLQSIFYEIIFEPVVEIIKQVSEQMGLSKEILNATEEPVREGLRSGRIQYVDGLFSGSFNASIGRALRAIGATFNRRTGTYSLNPAKVPAWIKAEAGVYKTIARGAHDQIKKVLGYIQGAMDQLVDKHPVRPESTLARFEKDFQPIARAIEVHPTLTTASKVKLAEDYTDNMKLWIKKFSEETIQDLRMAVEVNAHEGYRFDRLIDAIQQRYGVSQSKARFLARQETSLFMSKFRKGRFHEAGVRMYKWSTSHDERVRDDHKHLNGRVFSYDQPPIVDRATGRTGNPGEDFNCRCVDIPVLGSVVEAA